METRLLLVLLAPFALALLMPWLGARLGARTGWLALLAPLTSFAAVLSIYLLPQDARTLVQWPWIPSLGVTLTFMPDGLALFFGLVVTGVGVLVTFYAANYLDDHYRDHGKFYCYLLLFMGAMLDAQRFNPFLSRAMFIARCRDVAKQYGDAGVVASPQLWVAIAEDIAFYAAKTYKLAEKDVSLPGLPQLMNRG